MGLSPYEENRSRRERDFHRRVLALLEKPKQRQPFAFLNSPFFLWILSATAITLVGAYFTRQQQCMADRDLIVRQHAKLSTELTARRAAVERVVLNANTLHDIAIGFKAIPYVFSDFKDRTIYELQFELIRLEDRISAPYFSDTRNYPYELTTPFYVHVTPQENQKFHKIVFAIAPDQLKDEDLPRLKYFVSGLHLSAPASGLITRGYELRAVCSALDIFRNMFRSDSVVVEAVDSH